VVEIYDISEEYPSAIFRIVELFYTEGGGTCISKMSVSTALHCIRFQKTVILSNQAHETGRKLQSIVKRFLIYENWSISHSKPTRCTNFSNLFLECNSTCFGQFLCPSSGIFHFMNGNGICNTGMLTACEQDQIGTEFHPDPARKLSENLYDIYHCCV
jgi:hypothetical protein